VHTAWASEQPCDLLYPRPPPLPLPPPPSSQVAPRELLHTMALRWDEDSGYKEGRGSMYRARRCPTSGHLSWPAACKAPPPPARSVPQLFRETGRRSLLPNGWRWLSCPPLANPSTDQSLCELILFLKQLKVSLGPQELNCFRDAEPQEDDLHLYLEPFCSRQALLFAITYPCHPFSP